MHQEGCRELHSSVRELTRKQHLQRWKSSRQTTSEINQPAKSIGRCDMYKGIAGSEGIGIGNVVIIEEHEIVIENKKITDTRR